MASSQPTAGGASDAQDEGLLKIPPKYKAAAFNYLRIFSYATSLDKIVVTASCFAAFGSGLTMPAMYILFGRLTGDFTGFFKQGVQETEAEFIHAVDEAVLQIAYVFLIKLCLTYLANLGLRVTSLRISSKIRVVYLRSLFSLPISTLDMLPAGQTAAIITTVASNLQLGISEKLSVLFSSVAMVLGSMVIAFMYDWLLTVATSLGLILIGAVYYGITPQIAAIMASVLEQDIKASCVPAEALNPTAVRMLAACGAEAKIVNRYSLLVDEGYRKGGKMAPLVALQNGLINFAVYATFALAFWVAFQMYMLMEIDSPEPLIVVLLSTILMASSIGQMSAPLSAALQAAEAVAIFHTIIDFPKPVYGSLTTDISFSGDIALENVNFAYPARPEVKVLDNLNMRFPSGKITAIVGPSGAGKSTIVGIIERWYEFNGDPVTNPLVLWCRNGLVTASGTKLTDIDPKWWRSQVGLVQQENILFDASIYTNVEYGLVGTQWEHVDARVKARMIKNACTDAFADDFITRLPDGYQTAVGQGGVKLSGGQRQRLAIARAIVKQPKVLILDEATSAIDVRSERIVQAALDRASKGRTTIVVAHRLGTIRKADNIIVLRKGQVVQQGTHASLLDDVNGPYHRLVLAQNIDVQDDDDSHQNIEPSSPGTTWTDETLVRHSPLVQRHERSLQDPEKLEDDVDKTDMLEGRVRVLDGTSSRNRSTLWVVMEEQAALWRPFLTMLFGGLGAGAATPIQAYLFSILLSLFSSWDSFLYLAVNFWVLMMVVLAVGVGIGNAALGWSTTRLGFAVTTKYRKDYFTNMVSKPASFFDDETTNSAGALTSRLSTDPTQLQQFVGINMAALITSGLNLLGCVTIALVFGWKLTLVALITTFPIVMTAMIYRVRYEMDLDRMSNAVFADSARFACESIAAIRTAVSLTLEESICQRYELLLLDHIKNAFRKATVSVLLFSLSDSIPLLCMAFVLWYGGQLLGDHEYSPFQYMVVYIAVLQGGMSAGQWLSFGPNISQATLAADRILSMRADDDENTLFENQDPSSSGDMEKAGMQLEFQDVTFRYPTRSAPVLDGLSMKIKSGQFAAIVGPSGSGKSTIISLLERFYTPQHGKITQNGVDITDLDLNSYRQKISLVAQEASLFSGTIRDNITLGIPELEESNGSNTSAAPDSAVEQAARDAGVHDFIISLPEGYNTPIGTGGLALSGGQKQRISLARALIRQPGLLLLDEATSSLDSETEAQVQAVLDATKGTRTMIVVAHRLATVQNADVIFVLGEDGALVEQGTHSSLISKRGVYYSMCQMQTMDSD